MSFFVSLYLGERYIYYATGLFGVTPTHSKYADEDLRYYDYQGFGCKVCKGGLSSFRTVIASNVTWGLLTPIVKSVCTIATQEFQMCDQLFDSFAFGVSFNLFERIYDVNYM